MGEIDLELVKTQLNRAADLVGKLASGEERWKMSIPAQPDRDSDLVLADGLGAGLALLAALEEARRERDELVLAVKARDVAVREADQLRSAAEIDRDRADECRQDFARMAMENAEKAERMRPVVEKAQAWRTTRGALDADPTREAVIARADAGAALAAAVDSYEKTQESTDE